MQIYRGQWCEGVAEVTVDGKPLQSRTEVCHHSDKIAWGYKGDAPLQLSLDLLAHHFGRTLTQKAADSRAVNLHLDFVQVVAGWNKNEPWVKTSKDLEASLKELYLRNLFT